jgi:hypothetical protein
MDFTKFVSLLDSSTLWFASVEELRKIDPYEGYYPMMPPSVVAHLPPAQAKEILSSVQAMIEGIPSYRAVTLVNCWHLNEYESAPTGGLPLFP